MRFLICYIVPIGTLFLVQWDKITDLENAAAVICVMICAASVSATLMLDGILEKIK